MLIGSLSPAPQETKFQGADKVPRGVQNLCKNKALAWLFEASIRSRQVVDPAA
jgi:hypothetical protein